MLVRFGLYCSFPVSSAFTLKISSRHSAATCVGGTAAAPSQFGTGAPPFGFVPLLTGIPRSGSSSEVLVRAVSAGDRVQFTIATEWNSRTYWASSGGTDQASITAFSDTDYSLRMSGSIIQQTSPTTWVMHLDDAASYLIDDDDNDILIQLRLVASASTTQTQILPQFAFGGGWYSALYFTNTGTTAVSIPVSFMGDDGKPLIVPSAGGSSVSLTIPPRGTAVFEAPDFGPLMQGYASVIMPAGSGIVGYGIFRESFAGQPDQEAVVPFSGSTSTASTLIWDDTNFVTAASIVNLSSVQNSVTVSRAAESGGQTKGAPETEETAATLAVQ